MRYRTAIKTFSAVLAVWLAVILCLDRAQAPVLASSSDDAAAVAEAIDRLPVVGSALMTAAHPDDENSVLMPYLTHALHLRAAYFSATRGDGGQNLLGSEQYEALGILRTEELLAARRVDGAQQFFGQEYDFGFSKSAEETLQKWGHDDALGDYVRMIRQFRPDILISRFGGTPADGHGHHQASGILTREAYRAAADPNRFPEQIQAGLKPWLAAKFVVNTFNPRGAAAAPSPDTVTINLDQYSPVEGETYGEMGAKARSMHRSQGMGTARYAGPVLASFRLEDSSSGGPKVLPGLFDGVDLTLNRFVTLSGGSADVTSRVHDIALAIAAAQKELSPFRPSATLPALAHGLSLVRQMRSDIEHSQASADLKDEALFLVGLKEADFVRAISLAGGVRLDTLADKGEIVPGETFNITVSALIRASDHLKPGDLSLRGPSTWKIEKLPPGGTPVPGDNAATAVAKFRVTVPVDAPVSQPYWLINPRVKDRFSPPPVAWVGAAENPALFQGTLQYSFLEGADPVAVEQQSDVVYRYADRINGERDVPLNVVPPVAIWATPEVAIFPLGSGTTQALMVKVRNNRSTKLLGMVHLNLPAGWRSNPPAKAIELASRGDELSARFEVSPPSSLVAGPLFKDKAEEHSVPAVAEVEGRSYNTGYQVIDYPHIQTRYWFQPALSKLLRFDVKVASGLRVGYVMGTGDSVPDALKQLGVAVEQLGADDLAFGNLAKFDAIVTGIRAYEVRKDLVANNSRLMDYVHNGGLMIVQYSRPAGVSEPLGPYPMTQKSAPRVTVEDAPVDILEPVDPFFQSPNRITDDDFKGWVQERGVYFMDSWAPEYRPLLASHDPGEMPLQGGMLLASYGKGLYLYTGYVWNRQLPAGVPGAYRIFANMISLGRTVNEGVSQPGKPSAPSR